jgi:LmbE family N-acetylglucosaminyl deacetylase
MTRPLTIVAFHAHPDDEALLTGGTLARAAAAGHRVILVTATGGEAGLADAASTAAGLGQVRTAELARAATALGVSRSVLLGYADSGLDGTEGGPGSFVRADLVDAAERLAAVLVEERADVLIGYDEHGGYGHPDHVRAHDVALLAAGAAHTPRILQATVDRDLLRTALRIMRLLRLGRTIEAPGSTDGYLPREQITHRVDIRAFTAAKRAAMAAHVSQAGSPDGADRTLALLLRLPVPVFRLVCGHEWYAEVGAPRGRRATADLFPGYPW